MTVGVLDAFMWSLSGQISMILTLLPLIYKIYLGPLAFINCLTNTFILPSIHLKIHFFTCYLVVQVFIFTWILGMR